MSDYQLSTRECTLEDMHPSLAAAVRQYSESHQLDAALNTTLFCGETTSTRQKKGLLSHQPETILTGFLLAPPWLIWAVVKEGETPAVLSVRLRDIQVQDYAQSEMYRLVPDSGLNVSGLRHGSGEAGTAFIGLGPEAASQMFRDLLRQAITRA